MDSIVMVFPSAFGELGASVSEQLPEPPVTRTLAMSTSGAATNSVIPAPDGIAVASPAAKLGAFQRGGNAPEGNRTCRNNRVRFITISEAFSVLGIL